MSSAFTLPLHSAPETRSVLLPLSSNLGISPKLPVGAAKPKPLNVLSKGPEFPQGDDGGGYPVWLVFVVDKNRKPLGTNYRCSSFAKGKWLAQHIAMDRHLGLIQEATED